MTKTSDAEPAIPSSSASIWLTMRSITPAESPCAPRFGAIESSSSKNTTHGRAARARAKTRRTFASDSPMYMFSNSGPFTEKKFSAQDVATAFASRVLPVPGGPYNRMPVPPLKTAMTISDDSHQSASSCHPQTIPGAQEAVEWYPEFHSSRARARRRRPKIHLESAAHQYFPSMPLAPCPARGRSRL